jgi:hypothetical protein
MTEHDEAEKDQILSEILNLLEDLTIWSIHNDDKYTDACTQLQSIFEEMKGEKYGGRQLDK